MAINEALIAEVDIILTRLKSDNTREAYRHDVLDFLEFVAESGTDKQVILRDDKFTTHNARAWLVHRAIHKGLSKRSNNRAMSALRFICRSLYPDNNPMAIIKLARTNRLLPKPASHDAIMPILEMTNISWIVARDKALIALMYCCGLRISEALNLKADQIGGSFIKVVGKGNKERIVPIPNEALSLLKDYILVRPHGKLLFIGEKKEALSRSYFARRLRTLIGVSPHMLRHGCATHLVNRGVSIKIIQQLLGHASLQSTQIYTEVSRTHLLSEYDRCHPGAKTPF